MTVQTDNINLKKGKRTFILDENSLDEITVFTQNLATAAKTDEKTAKRYAFLMDNALYYWLEHGARGKELTVSFGRKFFTPYISVELEGEKLDPYSVKTEDYGFAGNDVIVMTGQVPSYDYRDGNNIITLNLKRQRSLIREILIVTLAAIIVGILGNLLLSADVRAMLLGTIISPLVDAFFNVLRCIAGPMVFFSVAWGICGIGDSRLFGKVGKSVLLYSVLITALGALIGAFSFVFIGNGFEGSSFSGGNVNSLFDMILGIVPSSIVEPFSTGNTLQIIFIAVAVGITLITISHKVRGILRSVNQINLLVQHMMGAISKLVPFIVFLLITNIIWTDSLGLVLSMWKFFAAMLASFIVISIVICAITSIKHKVPFIKIVKKNLSSLIIALTTASSAAAFGNNVTVAREKFGISDELTGFSIPLGMIVHNPIAACYNIVLVIYFAAEYNISCSVGWLVIGIIVCTVVAISSPPIPGGAAVSYALLLAQMGIPDEALGIILVVDIITDFIVTAFESYLLPVSLVNIAGRLKQLNTDKLRK